MDVKKIYELLSHLDNYICTAFNDPKLESFNNKGEFGLRIKLSQFKPNLDYELRMKHFDDFSAKYSSLINIWSIKCGRLLFLLRFHFGCCSNFFTIIKDPA